MQHYKSQKHKLWAKPLDS